MRIWAHRGCSQNYPENTLTSFERAMKIDGLSGIELDIQLTKDGELVVIHDEKVDRTTDGIGFVRDFTLKELKTLHIRTGKTEPEYIPTMREVFELLLPRLSEYKKEDKKRDFRLNIELKNSIYPYPGMEQKIVDMVHEFGVQEVIVYSSFYAKSLMIVHDLEPDAEIGVLDGKASNCLYKAKGMEALWGEGTKLALHPGNGGIDIAASDMEGRTVREWFGGHLFPSKPTGGRMDFEKLESMGVTDVFLNEPEAYLS